MKTIEEISLSGSGVIEGENKLRSDDMELSISGSGDMNLEVDGARIETQYFGLRYH